MKRIVVIHWKPAEAEPMAERLRKRGYSVEVIRPEGGTSLNSLTASAPDAFLIDLSRLPSQGRAVAVHLRRRKHTRAVPLIFLGGDPEKVAQTRQLLPDAVFTSVAEVPGALEDAILHVPSTPVVPEAMDAYSGTPLAKKLNIRAGSIVALAGAPPGFEKKLEDVPDGVALRRDLRKPADIILLFVMSAGEMTHRFQAAAAALADSGGLWIAWPKKTSGVRTDLSGAFIRQFGLNSGFVDYKVCAIDETWSGLLFARRGGKRAKRA